MSTAVETDFPSVLVIREGLGEKGIFIYFTGTDAFKKDNFVLFSPFSTGD